MCSTIQPDAPSLSANLYYSLTPRAYFIGPMGKMKLKQLWRCFLFFLAGQCQYGLESDPCSYSLRNSCSQQSDHRWGAPYRSSQVSMQWLHFCIFHFCQRCHCGRQNLRGLSGPFCHKDYLSSPLLTTPPHTTYNLRHLLTIVIPRAFYEMSYFDQTGSGNCSRK